MGRYPAAWNSSEEFWPEQFLASREAVDFQGNNYQLILFITDRRIFPDINFAVPVLETALVGLLHPTNELLGGGGGLMWLQRSCSRARRPRSTAHRRHRSGTHPAAIAAAAAT
uniref:Uncharacterized protein n=1 Tax=Oryza sativa subsp. japonica TaxID=39947 RepID=Q8S7E6_ORYSJ|nr:hypothetical protein [Oryza sativa Japonica Group]